MIEVNLIPDVKQELIKAQRARNQVISISVLVGIAAGGLVTALVMILGGFALTELNADNDIKKYYDELRKVEDIDKIVTIQNQLTKISELHENKGINSRVFDVLTAINPPAPNDVKISRVVMNPTEGTLTIEGEATNGFKSTETLEKTVLNTKIEYIVGNEESTDDEDENADKEDVQVEPLTQEVTIGDTSFTRSSGSGGTVLRFTISFSYPEALFSSTMKSVKIVSPTGSIDVTDSRTGVPESLFTTRAKDSEEEDGGR